MSIYFNVISEGDINILGIYKAMELNISCYTCVEQRLILSED